MSKVAARTLASVWLGYVLVMGTSYWQYFAFFMIVTRIALDLSGSFVAVGASEEPSAPDRILAGPIAS